MKFIFLSYWLFAATIIAAQNNADATGKRIDTIHSKILNEDRYVWVHIPENAKGSSKRYPVIYILDGEVHYDEVNNILMQLSKETGRNVADEMIVVSIGNLWQRYRDFSPSHITSSPWVDSYNASITGGGDKFISFIEKELFPHINTTTPASFTRILIGHSMGGLITMDILLNHTALFNYYAAIDPSMWWDDEKLLNESKAILANKTFDRTSLFLAVANTMDKSMNVEQIRKDTSAKTVLIRSTLTLLDHINANKQNKLKFEWKFYKDEQHMTVPRPAIYDALKFFLGSL
ncbi:MAG: alpha/beta hydrolase-fold protein [Bacteroidota bacterium]